MTEAELEAYRAETEVVADMNANPAFRIPMTFSEMFAVGALVSLVSVLLPRNRFLPCRPTV